MKPSAQSPLFLLGVLFFALLFYLTPLKDLNLVEPTIEDTDPKEFFEKFSLNPDDYIFIDVRPPAEYRAFHAKGSVNMPIHTLYNQKDNLPKSGKTIVLICTGGALSGVAYHYLEHHGFLNLKRIESGVRGWEAAGLPVVFNSADAYGSE